MSVATDPEPINNLSELMEFLRKAGYAGDAHSHLRHWFRGHGNASWKLSPGVYRPTFKFTGGDESDRLKTEQHLTQDWRVMSAGVRKGDENEVDLYFLQQHYGLPTRLLDWSTVPLAGLYFAVSDPNEDESDGMLYVMDAYQLSEGQVKAKEKGFKGIATSRNTHFRDFVHVLSDWREKTNFPPFILPVRPDYRDRRMTLQRGCFTAHPPGHTELTPAHNRTLKAVRIPSGDAKKQIRQELALLGFDDFTIYGDLVNLAKRLKSAWLRG